MEHKFSKEAYLALKQEIKKTAKMQTTLRMQRKTVNFTGERIYSSPASAQSLHARTRYLLRHMYIAYAIIRGKDGRSAEINSRSEYKDVIVKNIIEEYACEAVPVS